MAVTALTLQARTVSDDLWMVRTSGAATPCPCLPESSPPEYLRLTARGVWTESSCEAFFATEDPQTPTVVFAPGAFTDESLAIHLTKELACVLRCRSGGQPARVVLWKWPSERFLRRIRPSLQLSVRLADFEGHLFARWLRQFDPQAPPLLIGWSAGCRVIVGALAHFAKESATTAEPAARFPVVLAGAAIDAGALRAGRHRHRALDAVREMLVVHHRRDLVLRLYPRIVRGPRPVPIGLVGITCPHLLGEYGNRVDTMDLTGCITGRHYFAHYLHASPLAIRLARLVFARKSAGEQCGGRAEGGMPFLARSYCSDVQRLASSSPTR